MFSPKMLYGNLILGILFLTLRSAAANPCTPDSPLATPLFQFGPVNPSGIHSILPLGHIEARDKHVIPFNQLEVIWDWAQSPEARSIQLLAPAQITKVTQGGGDYTV